MKMVDIFLYKELYKIYYDFDNLKKSLIWYDIYRLVLIV